MTPKQKNVLALLANTQLISNEIKTKLQVGVRHFNDQQLDDVMRILNDSLAKQQEILIKDAVIKNPSLVEDMKKIIKEEVRYDLQEREQNDRTQEENKFNFDSALDSIFNETTE